MIALIGKYLWFFTKRVPTAPQLLYSGTPLKPLSWAFKSATQRYCLVEENATGPFDWRRKEMEREKGAKKGSACV